MENSRTDDPQDGKDKDQESQNRRPDADEPVTHQEHGEEALEEASERMLRKPAD